MDFGENVTARIADLKDEIQFLRQLLRQQEGKTSY